MPATERAFSEIPPAHLYLDTDIILDYLVSTRPFHSRSVRLLERIVEHGFTTTYLSSLPWMEFAHVIRHTSFRANLPDELLARFPLDQWQNPAARQRYREFFMGELDKLLENFEWAEIELTRDVRLAALELLDQYNIGAHDAVHLASASLANVLDLASFDRAFRQVNWLYLWNDQCFAN